ncbi:MAG: rod shape-determining protein MreC [Rickettsiales bacterium]|jgi:rod shape-determining protein MreC|nr:rod shape-determining protein MreC [Rickettsiales bacterium]
MKPIYRSRTGPRGLYWSIAYRIQIIVSKISYGFLLIFSVILLFYGKNNEKFGEKARTVMFYHLEPFMFVTRGISTTMEKCLTIVSHMWSLSKKNNELVRENFSLRLKLFEFDMIRNENNDFREVLNFISGRSLNNYMVKKINLISTHGFVHSVLIPLSETERKNTTEHDLVLDRHGNLVGRVVNVTKETAEIMLVSDHRSKIPAILETSKFKVILCGNGTDTLDIGYIFNNETDIPLDEDVYTSNDGSLLQEGTPIGRTMKGDKRSIVKLNSNLNMLDFVIILQKNYGHQL